MVISIHKTCFLVLCFCFLLIGCTTPPPGDATVDVKDIKQRNTKVLGSSGLPFGTIFLARGEFMKNDLPSKNQYWIERLRVTYVNGLKLDEPYLINVDTRRQGIDLEVSDDIQLIGYESGYFTGQPDEFANYTNWIPADIGFCFIEKFTVIREAHADDLATLDRDELN